VKKVLLGVFVIVVLALCSVMFVPAEKVEQVGMIELCRDIAKDSMKSPSSYRMNSATIRMGVGLPELGARKVKSEDYKKMILSGEVPYRTANVTISQEASNSYGVMLSSETYCSFSLFGSVNAAGYHINSVQIGKHNLSEMDIIIGAKSRELSIGKSSYIKRIKYLWYVATSKI